ncbi:hypothetical protein [Nocardia sp. NPDC051570]|uniref:hypothetical protein n=1 Tax=Nocardia sp. NPDC051570 TaxID=3364324 RepID=UPI00378D446B
MGEDKVEVDTAQLRNAAGKVDDVAVRVWNTVKGLENTLNEKGYPFGHDNYGKKFTDGDSGYEKSSHNLMDGAENMTRSLNQFRDSMRDAAQKMDDMDK